MKTFNLIDTSTGKVVSDVEAAWMSVNGHVVTFYKNTFDKEPCGIIILNQNLAVLEAKPQPNE